MRKKLYLLFALSLVLPATSSKAEAQVVYPLPPPNAKVFFPGEACEPGCLLSWCDCTIMPPIIIT